MEKLDLVAWLSNEARNEYINCDAIGTRTPQHLIISHFPRYKLHIFHYKSQKEHHEETRLIQIQSTEGKLVDQFVITLRARSRIPYNL